MEEYVELKCKSCGSALNPGNTNSDTIECPYCGSVQQRVDSKKYLEQVKGEMMAWLSKAIPSGMGQSATETMDPIARHNIFNSSVRPNIENEMSNYRFAMMSLLGNPLVLMPRECYDSIHIKHDSKKVFELDAKTKSVSQLAVDDDSKNLLELSSAISVAYASVINSALLFKTDGEGRYHFVTNNFNNAAEAVKNVESMKFVYDRFVALALLSEGITDIIEGRAPFGKSKVEEAKQRLTEIMTAILEDLDYSIMFKGLKSEIAVCDSMLLVANAVSENPALDPAAVLGTASNLVIEMEREEDFVTGTWEMQLKRTGRVTDIFRQFNDVLAAKSGQRKFKVAKGEGNCYVPMWAVEVTYSFVTGALFKKRAVEVTEMIFMSSLFITDPYSMKRSGSYVTDVFGSMPESSFMQRVKGEEKSISMGGRVREIYNDAQTSVIPDGCKCVIPMCTAMESEIFCNNYLAESKATHPKLSMGKAVAKELIFVPCTITETSWKLGINMGGLAPKAIGNTAEIMKISI